MWEQGLFLPKFIKFYDYRNLGTCRKQVIFLTMSIQEINKSLVLINLVGSQHKTRQLVDVANDFIVMITEHVFGIEFNLSDQLCPIIQLIFITFCKQTYAIVYNYSSKQAVCSVFACVAKVRKFILVGCCESNFLIAKKNVQNFPCFTWKQYI